MNQSLQVTCKNCGHQYEGNYCNICRQSAETHRFSWKEIAHFLLHAITHADKGIFHTIRGLFLRPGKTILDYLEGKRIYHFNPLMFIILVGGMTTFLFSVLHLNPPNEEIELAKIEVFNPALAHKYFAAVGLLFIIMLTATDYFFYYDKKFLLPELLISNTFQAGQIMVFTIAMIPLFLLQNFILQKSGINIDFRLALKALTMAFLFFTRFQFYQAKGKYWLTSKIAIQLIIVYMIHNLVIAKAIANWQG